MTKQQYEKCAKPFREHPKAFSVVKWTNRILTFSGFVLFPVLLILLYQTDGRMMLRCLFTAGISFVLVSVIRKWIDSERPYERMDIQPLIKKEKRGCSFPSRHVFSITVIAMCWFAYQPPVGWILIVEAVLMSIIRVIGGIHDPRDVVAGFIIGIVSGIFGLFLI